MGLDIYFYRVKKHELVSDDYNSVYDEINNNSKEETIKKINKLFAILKKAKKDANAIGDVSIYHDAYTAFKKSLGKIPYYKQYDYFHMSRFNEKVLTIDEVEKLLEKDKQWMYKVSDAYFRKVNFIYEFFEEDINHDNELALVNAEDIQRLINVCKDTLDAHKKNDAEGMAYAMANLPTRSGFFFGSTEYDDWYWNDVKDCIKQMKQLHKKLKEGDKVLISFSW